MPCPGHPYRHVRTANIGYLIPEFPGQTHNFFWRERHALRELGVDTQLISTRRPPRGIVAASWAEQAQAETAYLFPLSLAEAARTLFLLLTAGPGAWYRCAAIVAGAPGMRLKQRLRLAGLLPFAAKLALLARRQGWRHVHVHSCADAANLALLASQLAPCSYSLTLHGRLAGYGPNQARKWSHAAFAIAITQTLREELNHSIGGHLPERLEIAPMGVDVDNFARVTPYVPFDGTGELALFACGRLNPGKGYAYLLQALALVRGQGLAARLTIAGEDEQGGTGYRRELERQIAELGLGEAVTLLGAVAEETVRAHLERAHLFVLASLDEALGVVLMEAMAMGVPVIASDVGGVAELVRDGVDGRLIPPRDAAALADALRALTDDPELARRFSQTARARIVDGFSHRRSARVMARLLDGTPGVGCGS